MNHPFRTLLYRWVFVACLYFPATCIGQTHATKGTITKHFFSVEDGLASREVFCAIQDNEGFMWFGTRNGLNRYDGKNFKLFTKQKNGLAENKVIQLAKDRNNQLFIVYGNPGFSRSTMRIEVMDLTTNKLASLHETFPHMPFDEQSVYWVANGGGDLCFLTMKPFRYWRLTVKGFELKYEMKDWDVPGIYNDYRLSETGQFCLFYKDCALLKLGYNYPQYFCTPQKTTVIPPAGGIIAAIADGNLISPQRQLVFTWEKVYKKLNPAGKEKRMESIFDSYQREPLCFFSGDFPNALVYRAKDGLLLYDFTSLTRLLDPGEITVSSWYGLYNYYIDRQNNIWVCTAAGLIKIKQEKNAFTQYFTKEQLKDSSDNQSRGIYADTFQNVYAAAWTKFCYSTPGESKFSKVGTINILYGVSRCMNKIFVGEKELYVFQPGKKGALRKLTNGKLSEIWSLDSLAPGKLLIGCTDSIFTYDINKNEIQFVTFPPGKMPTPKFVYRFIKTKDKNTWAVAQNGLYLLDEQGERVIDYYGKAATDKAHQFSFDVLLDAYEAPDGVFWFATNGQGLFRWQRAVNEFKQFDTNDGLPSDILYRIESDDFNHLWISTDNGLLRFNTIDFKTRNYSATNGITHNEFNRASSFKAQDGRLYFGGLDGVNAFYPTDFIADSTVPETPMHLISLNQFSAEQNRLIDKTGEMLTQKKIVLQPGDRFFNLEFQLLDFGEGKPNYAYMITGIDKEWNYLSENSIRISGLPYGEYNVLIRGQVLTGQWSNTVLQIPLLVLKPFYLQWWFITLSAVATTALIFLLYKWRVRQLIKAKSELEKGVVKRTKELNESLLQEHTLLKEKDVLLKEIHHRVKNNLQVISGLLELQEKNLHDDGAKQALREGRTRVRSIALIHQNLYQYENLSQIELCSFVRDLYEQVAGMFESISNNSTASINIPFTQIDIDTAVPFGLALNELLTNSFKYGFLKGNPFTIGMELSIEKLSKDAGSKYVFVYRDNGPGMPPAFDISKSKSLGMRLVNDLSKQMGGSMQYAFDGGSRFTITFFDKIARKQND